jgi:hypothetical protein
VAGLALNLKRQDFLLVPNLSLRTTVFGSIFSATMRLRATLLTRLKRFGEPALVAQPRYISSMQVTISALSDGEPPIVVFDSAIGIGQARWMVGKPRVGSTYDVELKMPLVRWGEQIFLSDLSRPRIT